MCGGWGEWGEWCGWCGWGSQGCQGPNLSPGEEGEGNEVKPDQPRLVKNRLLKKFIWPPLEVNLSKTDLTVYSYLLECAPFRSVESTCQIIWFRQFN